MRGSAQKNQSSILIRGRENCVSIFTFMSFVAWQNIQRIDAYTYIRKMCTEKNSHLS